MRILLTNDDGIEAPGIMALKQELDKVGEVFVVAPERPRSASGHAITLHKALRLPKVTLKDGTEGWACSGTPSDCVTLGWEIVLDNRVDIVVSGINAGPNLGWDVTYSGTVSAALEGAILGAPAIAVSLAGEREPFDYGTAARFTRQVVEHVGERGMEKYSLLNINVPPLPADQICGVEITHQGRRQYVDRIDKRTDPWGRDYYWLCGSLKDEAADEKSDVHAVLQNKISVTPIHLDLTATHLISEMQKWSLTVEKV
ncbi:MAG: 5'/3'-nucleotidase SurE [Chthonomonadales bacterium]